MTADETWTDHWRRGLWRRGFFWLLLLAPLFFLSYGQVNQFTAGRENVGSVVFDWERHIPFLPWTIVPYWSIDILYGISLFICRTRREQTRQAWRLIAASLVACGGFLLFPLRFSFVRPHTDGLFGWLFDQLEMFDLPFNQAPSLHIMLTWLLWLRFWAHAGRGWRAALSAWFLLIAVSVLTTWQHHFIDVITGVAAGVVVSYLIPVRGGWRWRRGGGAHRRLAWRYAGGAGLCLLIAPLSPVCYVMLWPALALAAVALGYAGLGTAVFQKQPTGGMSPSAWLLLLPYLLAARLSMRMYTRRLDAVSEIGAGMFIGSYPRRPVAQRAVLDLTGEFWRGRDTRDRAYVCCPLLDLALPDAEQFAQAVSALQQLSSRHDTVLVHCALGLSRSALVVAGWLLAQRRAASVAQAVDLLRQRRSAVVLTDEHLRMLEQWNNRKR
ncbi:phosphatase PAP2/dual specificity phosphatase family protein [Affinibrenneria salicis]|uniref:Phosphatase PAP2/dual specificity phosphatase family protein n=1 Tax=Affinibrenneria salicis TaxID=2590031 RepID=A0A5J5FV91_9GAMM|nr:phosphatase PAP2/dual specificity phosphatase family protein [Affinibrenneria salicis]KAA8997039.1 phosphatase PAP2/dual specificity phosphatase family protein [Affinibrenneria salicis]